MANGEDFRPTLLVGVGGTGCDIAERVHRLALEAEMGRQGRIGILGLDTDANDMRRMRGLEQRSQVRFSTPDTVYQLLDKSPGLEQDWFGPRDRLSQDILNMSLVDGAAQIRLLTRLAFHYALARSGIDIQISDALATLARHSARDRFEGVVNVMLVGSLAGATGSGSFLQVALLLAALGRDRNVPVDVRGLFLLPDIFVRGAGLPREQVPNVLANAYAALKELNAINNKAGTRGDQTPFEFEYAPGRRVLEGGQPFRSLALIDFENTRGGSYGRNFEAYKAMAARAAYQLIFSPIGQKTASVGVNDARARLAAAAEGTHNLYAGLGVSAIEYPVREIVEYLTLRLAQENLGGDWLRLDRAYFDRVRRYEDQKRDGNLSIRPPDQGSSFLEDLDTLALKDNLIFFREIHTRLNPEVRSDDESLPEVRPRHQSFLDAVLRELLDRFWSTERMAEVRRRQMLDSTQFRSQTALVDNVRKMEFQLDGDLGALDNALKFLPEDLFRAVLLTGDDFSEAEWREYHLQTYIIKGGPHLVEVRAFLYALQQEIASERAKLDPAGARGRVLRAASIFDDTRGKEPTERRSPKILETARKAANGGFLDRLRKRSEQFAEEYVSYYNGSMSSLRAYAEHGLKLKVLDLLGNEVEEFSRALAGLFVELGAVFSRLSQQVGNEEARHNPEAGLVDGNVPVYADTVSKRALWDDLARRASGLRLGEDANRKLAQAVYRQYRDDRRERRPTNIAQLGSLFSRAIVDDFARTEVDTSFRGAYDFSIVEAVKRQSATRGEDWMAQLRRLVDLVSSQSEPFLSLTDQNDGQRVIFWAVNPAIRTEVNDADAYSGLFTFQQGEAPLEGDEFPAIAAVHEQPGEPGASPPGKAAPGRRRPGACRPPRRRQLRPRLCPHGRQPDGSGDDQHPGARLHAAPGCALAPPRRLAGNVPGTGDGHTPGAGADLCHCVRHRADHAGRGIRCQDRTLFDRWPGRDRQCQAPDRQEPRLVGRAARVRTAAAPGAGYGTAMVRG